MGKQVLAVLFICIFTFGCGSNKDETDNNTAPETEIGSGDLTANDGSRLKPVMISRVETLKIYENKALSKHIGELPGDEIVVVDSLDRFAEKPWVHFNSKGGVTGFADFQAMDEIRVCYAKKLNVREKPSTSGEIIGVLDRGDTVIPVPEITVIAQEDCPGWREIRFGNTTGWVADEYIIEKRFYDVLEPAIEKHESGDTSGMNSYLDDIAGRYVDIECSIAGDGETAIVLFDYYENTVPYRMDNKCLFLVGKPNRKVQSGEVLDYCFSPGSDYTYANYGYPMYACGYSQMYPIEVINNRTGDTSYETETRSGIIRSGEDVNDNWHLNREFVDDRFLLLLVLDWVLPEMRVGKEEYEKSYPCLIMVDLTDGTETVLLEPDYDTADGLNVRMRRSAACDTSINAIKKATETGLFKRCEQEILSGLESEA